MADREQEKMDKALRRIKFQTENHGLSKYQKKKLEQKGIDIDKAYGEKA